MADAQDPYAEAHKNPDGPTDGRPGASQVISDLGLANALTDRVMLVTGASSGIGVETVRALHATGATVFMQVRDEAKGRAVLDEIRASNAHSRGALRLVVLRLDELASVRAGAAALRRQTARLHVLVNNAGVRNAPEARTADGFETQLATNHLGHFLLFQLLRPLLLAGAAAGGDARVVNVSSGAHMRSPVLLQNPNLDGIYEPRLAYACSKTANVWMANHVERLFGARGLHGLSVHPGAILTGLQAADAEQINQRLAADESLRRARKSVDQGAATQVWAAVAPVWKGRGGVYLEDMRVSHETATPSLLWGGHKSFLFDEESERELWRISNDMVGFKDDEE